jgi:hypothetical protein
MNIPSRFRSENNDHILAHDHCRRNRGELEQSEICGCFYCMTIFSPNEIVEWIDDGQTAMCPHCPVDSVIGSTCGFPITKEFLERMNAHWF